MSLQALSLLQEKCELMSHINISSTTRLKGWLCSLFICCHSESQYWSSIFDPFLSRLRGTKLRVDWADSDQPSWVSRGGSEGFKPAFLNRALGCIWVLFQLNGYVQTHSHSLCTDSWEEPIPLDRTDSSFCHSLWLFKSRKTHHCDKCRGDHVNCN